MSQSAPEPRAADATEGRTVVHVSLEELEAQLLVIARAGMPVTIETAGDVLPYLRVVLTKAKATDHLSRVIALDDLLTSILKPRPKTISSEATKALFGLPPTDRRWSFAKRQAEAAAILGYHPDHFRKHVQADLIRDVAYELVRRDVHCRPSPQRRLLPEDRPVVAVPSADDDLEALELEARTYEALFALRADLIAVARLRDQSPTETERCMVDALWHSACLLVLVEQCGEKFGALLSDSASGVDPLSGILAWRGPFRDDEMLLLRRAAAAHPDAGELWHYLSGTEQARVIIAKWREWVALAAIEG